MSSWLKRAEDLFEVVDRRAKLVVSDLSDEQSNIPQSASNGKSTQSRKSKSKAKSKAKAQRRASPEEELVKVDRRQEESSSQPSLPEIDSDVILTSSTVKSSGLTTGSSSAHSNNDLQGKIDNSAVLDASSSDTSSNEVIKPEDEQKPEATVATIDAVASTSSIVELGSENVSPIPDMAPSLAPGPHGTEDGLENDPVEPGQTTGLKDQDDSVKLGEEKTQPAIDDAPSPVLTDGKKAKPLDGIAELTSNATKQEDGKEKISLNKVAEQLDEAQGLLKSTNSTGQSKEARLARVCAGLSSRLQEYKSENAQLEELLTAERELSKSYEDRIKHLQLELSATKREVSKVESSMADALATKNSEIETLVCSLDKLKKQAALSEGNMASIQANMETMMRNRELTETRMMQALREELTLAERRAEEERVAHNVTKKATMEREVEFEHRAVEAATALARAQRMADERAAKTGELEQKVALLEVECTSLNQELQDMESRLRREQKKSPEDANQLIQIQAWQQEVERARQTQREAESKVSSLEAELQKMRVEMAAMKRDAEHYSRQEHMELEKRYRELTDLLYYKQTQLETMASEKSAAEFQLEKENKRLQEAQAEAERTRILRPSPSWDEEAYMNELEPLPLYQRHMVGASIQLRKAVKLLDSGAVRATRILRRHPRARVGLLFYLIFVHLFLMYLLHRLQVQADDFAKSMGLSEPNLPGI